MASAIRLTRGNLRIQIGERPTVLNSTNYVADIQGWWCSSGGSKIRVTAVAHLIAKTTMADRHEPRFLYRYNNHWRGYFLVGGHLDPREDDIDFRKCMVREVEEELKGLEAFKDFEIRSLTPRFTYREYSRRYHVNTLYLQQFFTFSRLDRERLSDVLNRGWGLRLFPEVEILRGKSVVGRRIGTVPIRTALTRWPGMLKTLPPCALDGRLAPRLFSSH